MRLLHVARFSHENCRLPAFTPIIVAPTIAYIRAGTQNGNKFLFVALCVRSKCGTPLQIN